ncbi:hypothetical protein GGF45_001817, partial [Coemansia sp. RSA 551]
MESDTEPSTPVSTLEATPETEYENRIANLEAAPTQSTTEYFSWQQLADISERLTGLGEQYGALTTVCTGDYVALGTERGSVVVTDYLGRVKMALGSAASAAYGAVSALAFSADHMVLVAGYAQGFVVVWDWAKGTTAAVSRPRQASDSPDAAGHPAGTAITCVGFIGASRHRYISGSGGGLVLYHHIVRRLLTTMSTQPLASDGGVLFEAAALARGTHACVTDDLGLVAILTDSSITIVKTRHGVEQQYRTGFQTAEGTRRRTVARRPYAGSVAWQSAQRIERPATTPAESDAMLPKLAYSWGAHIHILAVHLDYNVSGNGTALGSAAPRVQFERETEWTAIEDVVFCRWIDPTTLLYMTQSQRVFVFETQFAQETEISTAPPARIVGRAWVTLTTGTEAEPSYAAAMCVHRRRLFAHCGSALYVGRLLMWAERLELLATQGQLVDVIALATGFYQARTGQIVVGLPRVQRAGDAGQLRRQALVGGRLADLMRRALQSTLAVDRTPRATDAEVRALATVCVQACLALSDMQILFTDVFESFASEPYRLAFLETVEPFILSGAITRVPAQMLNALIDVFGSMLSHVQRLGAVLYALDLQHGEFDIDRVLGCCRKLRLWRTFARVWLDLGDPIAPVASIIAAAAQENDLLDQEQLEDEAPGAVILDYLDMVMRGRSYPDGQLLKPQARAEAYSARVAQLVFPPATDDAKSTFHTLRALLAIDTERLLETLGHILNDPFTSYINLIVKPSSPQASRDSGRALRRASQVKSLVQVVVDALHALTMAAYSHPEQNILAPRQIGLLTSFALILYATRFPLVYLTDATVSEWSDVLLTLNDTSTRVERENAFELLFKLNPPPVYADYIDRVRCAGFFRVLEHIYYTLGQFEDALRTFLDHPDFVQRRAVFAAIQDLGAASRPHATESVCRFVVSNAAELVEVDADAFVETIETVEALDHSSVVDALNEHPQLQFSYMRALLDPAPEQHTPSDERLPPNIGLPDEQHIVVYPFQSLVPDNAQSANKFPQALHERYLELMCQYSPGAVLPYLKQHADQGVEPLRLASVQTVCARYGVSDGLVWALVRLGDFSAALLTLLKEVDSETSRVRAAVPETSNAELTLPDGVVPGEQEIQGHAGLTDAGRERLEDHLRVAERCIGGCVDVCKAALTRLGKDTPNDASSDEAQNKYRSLVSAQLCDLWLTLLRTALSHLHATNRTLDALPDVALSATREAWQLVSSRQRWMLQTVLDALIFAASPASSFISLRHIIQQLIVTGTPNDKAHVDIVKQPGAARSLDIAEIQHLLAVAVSAYKTEAQLMALTNVLVDYDLFTTFAQLVRSQKQGWRVPTDAQPSPALSTRHDLCCLECRTPLFADQRQEHVMAKLRGQIAQYYETSALRVLDLHIFEDRSAQWKWMKLRTA